MSKVKLLTTFTVISSQLLYPMYVYADEKRFDQTFMRAILTFARNFSFIPLIAALGFMFFSFKDERAELRSLALKCFVAFLVLFLLLPAAEAGGFA